MGTYEPIFARIIKGTFSGDILAVNRRLLLMFFVELGSSGRVFQILWQRSDEKSEVLCFYAKKDKESDLNIVEIKIHTEDFWKSSGLDILYYLFVNWFYSMNKRHPWL